jgi:hypothetical protein
MSDATKTAPLRFSCIVSNARRFVYVATPKVASSSIKWALLPLLQEADLTPEEIAAQPQFPHIHRYLRRVDVHLARDQFERRRRRGAYADYFCFSFVRNPWDRLVSCYLSKVAGPGPHPVRMRLGGRTGAFARGMPFAEFVRIVCDTPDERSNVHLASQTSILCDAAGALLPDFVGRFENLAADFAAVARRIAPERELPLPARNPSGTGGRDYRAYYSDADAARVGQRYARDAALFGYDFAGTGRAA